MEWEKVIWNMMKGIIEEMEELKGKAERLEKKVKELRKGKEKREEKIKRKGEEEAEQGGKGHEGKEEEKERASTLGEAEGLTPSRRGSAGEKEKGEGAVTKEEKWAREKMEGEKRRRNIVVRGLERTGKERSGGSWIRETFGKLVEIEKEYEVKGEGKEKVWVVVLKEEEEWKRVMKEKERAWREWKVVIGKDKTFEERKRSWILRERVREERGEGRRARVVDEEEGKIEIEGTEWRWEEREERWARSAKE